MNLVQQMLQISSLLGKKTLVSHTFWHKEIMNISITARRNLLIDVKGKRAAENNSSEVGQNI
jgi:hypothetical protein